MIKLENTQIVGLEPAIRGMRNPMNSWEKSDSYCCETQDCFVCPHSSDRDVNGSCEYWSEKFIIGPNDHDLMMRLAQGGPVHAEYRRMIVVYVDITAPLYWWKEFDTYKVGTVANSCSTMHKIHAKEFTLDDFSHEHLISIDTANLMGPDSGCSVVVNSGIFNTATGTIEEGTPIMPLEFLQYTIDLLNRVRKIYLETKDKKYWWQMIQLLPSSYNQKRTVMLNYEVLANIYPMRREHKLDEWQEFCQWIEMLPYSEVIIGEREDNI